MRVRGFLAALLSLGFVSATALSAQAAFIDGTQDGVIAPTFYSASGAGTQSYIRLFSGAGTLGTTSTFNVTVVGVPSGSAYGSTFTVPIPFMASVQYSMSQILGFAGAPALGGGDTSYAVYLKNSDPEAGYQHVTYSAVSNLFENLSVCTTPLNERMAQLHSQLVLSNIHTSKIGGGAYPSTIYIYNYGTAATTYTLNVFNGGNPGTTGPTVSANAGKYTCQYGGNTTVAANSMLAIPESAIEASSGCTIDGDEFYANILLSSSNGPLSAVLSHLVHASAYGGDSNLTNICAVNKATLVSANAPFIFNAAANTTFALTAPAGIQVFNIASLGAGPNGNPVATGTLAANPTGSVVTTATGFTLTLMDGKAVTFNTTPGAQGFVGPGHYDLLTADGTKEVEIYLTNAKTTTLGSSTYGWFTESDAASSTATSAATISTGLLTAVPQVPVTGSRTYTGNITGVVSTATDTGQITGGAVSLTFNYAAKTVSGSITGIATKSVQGTSTGTTSNITLTGTISGNGFSGTAATVSPPGGATIDIPGLTGSFAGTINGATALEVVGNIPIVSGGTTLLAAFGAHQ